MASHDRDDELLRLQRRLRYFAMIARLQLDPRLNAKIDMSSVIQDTLVDMNKEFEKEPKLVIEGVPQGLLRKVFENNLNDAIRRFRSLKRDVDREISLEETLDYTSARIQEWLAAEEFSPRHQAIKKEEVEEQLERLAEALEELLPDERNAIEWRYLRGWQISEIAKHLDRTKVAVAGLLKRGLEKLRKHLRSDPP